MTKPSLRAPARRPRPCALPAQRWPRERSREVRWLRDLIRAAVLRRGFPGGQLPGEGELMAAHDVARSTVREALTLLRNENLIERVQGIGTHAVTDAVTTALDEALGVSEPTADSILNRRLRPRVLDSTVIDAPRLVADRLRVPAGTRCLRLDYLSLLGDDVHGMATNYLLFPAAERVLRTPFVSDWYALLADAGVAFGASEFVIGCALADPVTAPLLTVPEGTPLLMFEQTMTDPHGRVIDFAVIHTPANRFRFVSRAMNGVPHA